MAEERKYKKQCSPAFRAGEFKKGQSGNPGGLPKYTKHSTEKLSQILARVLDEKSKRSGQTHAEEIIRELVKRAMTSHKDAETILNRVEGKPTERISMEHEGEQVVRIVFGE